MLIEAIWMQITFIKNNIIGKIYYKLLESIFLKNNACKLIHISTDEVYGDVLTKDQKKMINICQARHMQHQKLHLIIWYTLILEHINTCHYY